MNQYTVKVAQLNSDEELTMLVPPFAHFEANPEKQMWVSFRGDPESYWYDPVTRAWYHSSSLVDLCQRLRDLMLKGSDCEINTNLGTIKLNRHSIVFRGRETRSMELVSSNTILRVLTKE